MSRYANPLYSGNKYEYESYDNAKSKRRKRLSNPAKCILGVAVFVILSVFFLVHHTFYASRPPVVVVEEHKSTGPNNMHRDAFMKEKAETKTFAAYSRRENRRRKSR